MRGRRAALILAATLVLAVPAFAGRMPGFSSRVNQANSLAANPADCTGQGMCKGLNADGTCVCVTPTATPTTTPTPTLSPTSTATPTPTISPTPKMQNGGADVSGSGGWNIVDWNATHFSVTCSGTPPTCQVALTANVLTTSSTIPPSMLSSLAGSDQNRTFGTSAEVTIAYVSGMGWLRISGKPVALDQLVVGSTATPTPTPTAATPTPTPTVTKTIVPTPTAPGATRTATPAATPTSTPTSTATPAANAIVDGRPVTGCFAQEAMFNVNAATATYGIGGLGSIFAAQYHGHWDFPVALRHLNCDSGTDVRYDVSLVFELVKSPAGSCSGFAGDGSLVTCSSAERPGGGPICVMSGTNGTYDVQCTGTGELRVAANEPYNLRVINTLNATQAFVCQWLVCPTGQPQ